MPRHRAIRLLVLAVLPFVFGGCGKFLSGYAEGRSTELEAVLARHGSVGGQTRFLFDDLGSLSTDTMETHALPWKLVAAALVLDGGDEVAELAAADLQRRLVEHLTSFGFLMPESIGNWTEPIPEPELRLPIGIVTGELQRKLPPIRLEVANLGCAACHAAYVYDSEGLATRELWLGLPNTSLDLGAYIPAVYDSLKRALTDPARLLATAEAMFPGMGPREARTLRRFVLPRLRRRIAKLESGLDAPTAFSNGSPGVTNGVAALQLKLGLIDPDVESDVFGLTSIPDLGAVFLRSSLLYDGAYTIPGGTRFEPRRHEELTARHQQGLARIVTFFTVPTMGMEPGALEPAIPRVEEILTALREYRPPPFPGPVDADLARRGGEIYDLHCGECHGTFGGTEPPLRPLVFPNRLSPQTEIGTDRERWQAMDRRVVEAVESSQYGSRLDAASTGGYVATPLTGLWATAPYLHNGSVPTLWHLLSPEERPESFLVGGHRLDYDRVGVAGTLDEYGVLRYPEGYRPWSTPQLYDTSQPGRSNRGHEAEMVPLSQQDKRALLEYLKLL